jgi:hypothetical protein
MIPTLIEIWSVNSDRILESIYHDKTTGVLPELLNWGELESLKRRAVGSLALQE